ncbi:MAG: Wzz/FepE/Etk N-terminal domain-containing protein [Alcaligenes pakistanensis]
MAHHQNKTEETDLADIIWFLCSKKWQIVGTTFLFVLLAVAYVFLATPVYRSEAFITQTTPAGLKHYNLASEISGPAISDLLNPGRGPSSLHIDQIEPKDAYNIFRKQLNSLSLKRAFFEFNYLPETEKESTNNFADTTTKKEDIWNEFLENMVINTPDPEQVSSVSLSGTQPKILAPLVMKYIELAEQRTRTLLVEKLQSDIDVLKHSVEAQLSALRKTAEVANAAALIRLRDAYTLAQAIHLESPPVSGNLITSYEDNNLYLRGTKALLAEIEIREKRVNYDPYINELNNLEKKRLLLNSIKIDKEKIVAIKIEDEAKNPITPIKPRKLLTILLAFLTGLITSTILFTFNLFLRKKT